MILPQQYFWSGNGTENDFFDEENWVNYSTNQEPNNDIFSPNSPIEYELYLTCEININQEVILGVNGKIVVIQGEFNADKISGEGEIVLHESSYINLTDDYPISEGISIKFNSSDAMVVLTNTETSEAYYYYDDNTFYENQPIFYPQSLRIDNYYENGSVLRPNSSASQLTVYSEFNLLGNTLNIDTGSTYNDEIIPSQFVNNISSFTLNRGYMVTFAQNSDGTGKSKVYIASEERIEINQLPSFLNNDISFIRVVPWNWVSKKGTAGDIDYLNNSWFYRWSNTGEADLEREYAPMAWGKGAADDENDIDIIKNKYKSTHVLAFNEPDDCNGQSGQYGDMCVVDTAVTYYKNLLKTGLRMVSPACRQGAVFDWLVDFNNSAIQQDIRIDVIAVHWYDWAVNPQSSPNANPQDVFNRFANYLNQVHNLYGLPIWITEFNANRYRNEWVHRQFLELALPYLDNLNYVERYSYFPPNNGVANLFDENGNLTLIGNIYNDFESEKSISNDYLIQNNNLDYTQYENDYEYECYSDDVFLSEGNLIDNIGIKIYPNPSSNILHISSEVDVVELKILDLNGKIILNPLPSNKVDISSLKNGIYLLKVNNSFIKVLKN